VNGKNELIPYLKKLLSQNPHWIWTQIEPIPMEGGFLNKWLAKIQNIKDGLLKLKSCRPSLMFLIFKSFEK